MDIERTVTLTGPRAGQSCKLCHGRFQFINGDLTLRGSMERVVKTMEFLARNYSAYEKGSPEHGKRDIQKAPEHADPKPSLLGRVQPSGAGSQTEAAPDGSGPDGTDQRDPRPRAEGNGHADAGIQEALKKLDPANDKHWIGDGRPSVAAVSDLVGRPIMRRDITAIAPNLLREES